MIHSRLIIHRAINKPTLRAIQKHFNHGPQLLMNLTFITLIISLITALREKRLVVVIKLIEEGQAPLTDIMRGMRL